MERKKTYRLTMIEDMLGTVPKNPEVFSRYIQTERTGEDEIADVPEGQESGYTGFFTDDDGIYLYNYHIKGFLKEAGNILKDTLDLEGLESIKALKSKLDNYVFVEPRKIRIGKAPDGVLERPLRGMTVQGPRVSLAKSDYVKAGLVIEVVIEVLPNKHKIDFKVIEKLLDYGAYKGLGQWRNGSYGQFTWQAV